MNEMNKTNEMSKTKPLTKRQEDVLNYIKDHLSEHGLPPTRQEISTALGFRSANAAEEHLKALRRKNAIVMIPNASRGIQIVDNTPEKGLPLVGRVAAGNPILAEENIEAYHELPPHLFKPRAHFLLRVEGMSMKDAGILDGDLLAVHKTSEAKNGQVVVARIDDEVTVKRFKRRQSKIYLLPENEEFEPIVLSTKDQNFSIEGLAVGTIRTGGL